MINVIIVLDHITPTVLIVLQTQPEMKIMLVFATSSGVATLVIYGVESAILSVTDAMVEQLRKTVFYVSRMPIALMENVFVVVDGEEIGAPTGSTTVISSVTRLRIQFVMDGQQETAPSVLPTLIEITMAIVSVIPTG